MEDFLEAVILLLRFCRALLLLLLSIAILGFVTFVLGVFLFRAGAYAWVHYLSKDLSLWR